MEIYNYSVVSDILANIDSNLHSFVFNGYGALADKVKVWVVPMVAIAVAGYGWAIMRGRIDTPIQNAAQLGIKIGVITMLATNWHHFSEYIYNFVTSGPDEISSAIMRAKYEFFSFGSVESGLQKMLSQGLDKSGELFHKGSITNLTPFLIGLMVLLVTLLICGLSIGLLVLAKAGLAVCLILAPLMILTYLYESTKNICEKWAQHLIGFALMPIGIHAVMLLVLAMANNALDKIDRNHNITLTDCASYLIIGIVSIPLMLQVKTMVASIAHGFSFSSMGTFGQTRNLSLRAGKGAINATKSSVQAGSRAGQAASDGALNAGKNILQSVRRVG